MATHYGIWTYRYDDLGQLTNAVLASTDTNIPNQNLTYIYDVLGNRVRAVENGLTADYAINNLNQYTQVGTTTLNYDVDGSLTQGLAGAAILLSVTNNMEKRVTGFASTNGTRRFDYNALGFPSIVWRDGVATSHVYDPRGLPDLVAVYDEADGLLERKTHALGAISAADGMAETFLTFDPVGSGSESTGAAGLVDDSQAFVPFGNRLARSEGQLPVGFCGELGVMSEGELEFMRARFYWSSIGRFIQADPIGIAGGINLYHYARNQPTRYRDPSGYVTDAEIRSWGLDPDAPYTPGSPISNRDYYHFIETRGSPPDWDGFIEIFVPEPSWNDDGTVDFDFPSPKDIINDTIEWGLGELTPSPGEGGSGDGGDGFSGGGKGGGGGGGWGDSGNGFLCDKFPWLPWCDPDDSDDSDNSSSTDPNELTGPNGYGPRNFVRADSLLPYTIHFENATNATAPAQQVFITDQLTNRLDWQSFELTEIAFGDVFIAVPPGTRHFRTSKQLSVNGVQFEVQIEAGIRLASGEVYATFRSIVPTTGLPPGVETGFLPPENGTGRGQGHIGYVIRAHTNLTTGTEIRNVAFITFDQQPPIRTDQVDPHNPASGIDTNKQALVTIDADAPTSAIEPLPPEAPSAWFDVSWAGSDLGAGVTGYDVYVSTNGSPWVLWLANTPTTAARFLGRSSTHYCFYSVTRDGTGQLQPTNTFAVVCTTTPVNSPPVFDPLPTNYFVIRVNETLTLTNSATDPDVPAQQLAFSLAQGPEGSGLQSLADTSSLIRWTPRCAQGSTTNVFTMHVIDSGIQARSATTNFTVVVLECVEANLGGAVVQAGGSNSVAIRLLSTVELTNLSFTVVPPPARFTNFEVNVDTPIAPLPFTSNRLGGDFFLNFNLPANQILHGPTNVGELSFNALPNQTSAFVSLDVTDVIGHKPNGALVANAYGYPGRVVVIGEEPLLEAIRGTNGIVRLFLYAAPGTTNRVEATPELGKASSWQAQGVFTSTNLIHLLPPVSATNRTLFFRAIR